MKLKIFDKFLFFSIVFGIFCKANAQDTIIYQGKNYKKYDNRTVFMNAKLLNEFLININLAKIDYEEPVKYDYSVGVSYNINLAFYRKKTQATDITFIKNRYILKPYLGLNSNYYINQFIYNSLSLGVDYNPFVLLRFKIEWGKQKDLQTKDNLFLVKWWLGLGYKNISFNAGFNFDPKYNYNTMIEFSLTYSFMKQ